MYTDSARNLPDIAVIDIEETRPNFARPLSRISWGAIFAGVIIALCVGIMLNLLGLAIGAATVNPLTEATPVESELGIGSVIWVAASSLISMFTGGIVAGWMCGRLGNLNGLLHGLTVWAVATIIMLWSLTTSVGGFISGTANAISQGIGLLGQGVVEFAPEVADALELETARLQSIQEDVSTMFTDSGQATTTTEPSIDASATANANANGQNQSTNQMSGNAREFTVLLSRLVVTGDEAVSQVDRDELVNFLVANTEMTEEEARANIQEWEQTLIEARNNAEEATRQAGQALADAIAASAGLIFALMVVGAFAAGVGGIAGTPDYEIRRETREVQRTEAATPA